MLVSEEASPTIRGNLFVNNRANWGGALHVGAFTLTTDRELPTPTIEGNIFLSNVASLGGGAVNIVVSHTSVRGNTFQGNETESGDGGGIKIRLARGSASVVDNRFIDNLTMLLRIKGVDLTRTQAY